jgi:hypothetical protein
VVNNAFSLRLVSYPSHTIFQAQPKLSTPEIKKAPTVFKNSRGFLGLKAMKL